MSTLPTGGIIPLRGRRAPIAGGRSSFARRLDEHELPLPVGPDDIWLSDATVIGAAVDADAWPEWTDAVSWSLTPRGGGR